MGSCSFVVGFQTGLTSCIPQALLLQATMNRVVAHRLSRSQLTTKLRHNTLRWRSFSTSFSSKVNNFYQTGGPRKLPEPVSVASGSDVTDAQSILARDSAREWSEKDIKQAMKSHTLFTWGSS